MRTRFRGMTLQTLLCQHGITTIKELMHRPGLSRQHSWNLWHAKAGVREETAKRLHERLGIPAEALLQVDTCQGDHAMARAPCLSSRTVICASKRFGDLVWWPLHVRFAIFHGQAGILLQTWAGYGLQKKCWKSRGSTSS
jgi:hypothetical protein